MIPINLLEGETVRQDIALRSSPSKACLPSLQGWQVSPFIGSATYAYPLEVPAGAGGLRPPLALHYDSAATDGASGMREKQQAGWVGKGWTLDPGGAIALNRVVINLDTASWVDYYALTLNGRAYDLMRQEARAGVSNPDPNNPAHRVWRPTSDAALRIQADWIGWTWEGNPELGATIVTVVDLWERTVGGATTHFYRFGADVIGVRRSDQGTQYLFSDHLGSVSAATTASGALVGMQHYDPWGRVRTGGIGLTARTFTGQRLDATGLLYYHARYYDPALGRFISPDSIVPEPGNPQSLNRFAYVYNNPLKYTDPSGHCPICISVAVGTVIDVATDFFIAKATGTEFDLVESLTVNGATNLLTAGFGGKLAKLRHLGKLAGLVDDMASHGDEAADALRAVENAGDTLRRIPLGFKNANEFAQFGARLKGGLENAGYEGVQAIFQGSSVTGVKYTTGAPFDVGRVSDFDIALASPTLLQRAKELGIELRGGGTRTGPLGRGDLEALGLLDLREELSQLVGRDVNFMIYKSVEDAVRRSPSIFVP
ncbi:RHS repeat-associated core domain-containing protein [Roseiflexus sp. RS-1]|uniref:RHS repeat-associated core domain-containing protein n=1 Tax=Roseiflexus sp. (strain RS-1) TaxID=357808 RepID=UPI001E51CA0F|nr:RHS repeat-associated core domain-containing protein [Roseiflexus sp. RS-1]